MLVSNDNIKKATYTLEIEDFPVEIIERYVLNNYLYNNLKPFIVDYIKEDTSSSLVDLVKLLEGTGILTNDISRKIFENMKYSKDLLKIIDRFSQKQDYEPRSAKWIGKTTSTNGTVINIYEEFIDDHGFCDTLSSSPENTVGAVIHNPASQMFAGYYSHYVQGEIDGLWHRYEFAQVATDFHSAYIVSPLTKGAPHSANFCYNNYSYGIEMCGEQSNSRMIETEETTGAVIEWISERYHFAPYAEICHQDASTSGTACPAYSLKIHGTTKNVLEYINKNIPHGAYIDKENSPIPKCLTDDGYTSNYFLTGNRYLISGGRFLGSTYLGYNYPGGKQNMQFECDAGQYWADEYNYGSNRWFGLCDDQYRFFFIPEADANNRVPAGEHRY